MIPLVFTYATPSVFESSPTQSVIGLSSDQARPVRFHAKVAKHVLYFRMALQALGELIWHNDDWRSADDCAPRRRRREAEMAA
jgi:hypothetical protein